MNIGRNNDFESRYEDLIAKHKELIFSAQSINEKVAISNMLATLLMKNYYYLYSCKEVEEHLVSHISEMITADDTGEGIINNIMPKNKILHIITEPLRTGGHTKLMRSYHQCLGGDILITKPIKNGEHLLSIKHPSKVYTRDTAFTMKELLGIVRCYEIIILYVHPNDILVCAIVGAVKQSQQVRVLFVNHADHLFSYGRHVADISLEVSSYGLYASQQLGNIKALFIGIPIDTSNLAEIAWSGKPACHITSSGDSAKFRPTSEHNFPSMMNEILKLNKNIRFTVIGPRLFFDPWWWRLKLQFPMRVSIPGRIKFNQYRELIQNTNLYIDSFPLTGGTTLPEVRSLGTVVSGVNITSFGYTPLDDIKSESVNELIMDVNKFLAGDRELFNKNNDNVLLKKTNYFHDQKRIKKSLTLALTRDYLDDNFQQCTQHDCRFYEKIWLEQKKVNVSRNYLEKLLNDPSIKMKNRLSIFAMLAKQKGTTILAAKVLIIVVLSLKVSLQKYFFKGSFRN